MIFNFPRPYFGPQCPQIADPQPKLGPQCPFLAVPPRMKWTSMSISGGPTAYQMDLNASKNLGSWEYWKQPILRTSHPCSHSIKPVNWTAILAATQSKPVSESWRPMGRLKGGFWGGQPPQEESDDTDDGDGASTIVLSGHGVQG